MSREKPAVLFVDGHTWEAFSALAGVLRMRGFAVRHVTARPGGARLRAQQQLDVPLYGRPRRLVVPGSRPGQAATIPDADLPALVGTDVVDVQAHDDLARAVASAPNPVAALGRRVGSQIDPAVLYDKWVMAETVARFGIPTPRVWDRPTARSFPVVVKARTGFAGTAVRVAEDADQLARAWDDLTSLSGDTPFVQAFHGTGLVKSGGVAREGDLIVSAAYLSHPEPTDPKGPPLLAAVTSHPSIEGLTRRLVEQIGYTGFFNADWVIDDRGNPYLIDLNARAFGSWPALQACGVDFVGAYLHILDMGPRPVPAQVRHGEYHRVLQFPFPCSPSRSALLLRRRQSLEIIEYRRGWLGNRWASVSRAKVELATAQEWARLRMRA
ncbi:MAG: ATP-grasp domain-containing protein [Candidatus Nanopelagicales bacterium]|nr:ATP-grasp domain-containing protein [Candidatus Nanopelagicales bacterium]MDZ4248497.1 ATP-grasp domain-containing protein [Candidatus Nanopelagicales bacterium]